MKITFKPSGVCCREMNFEVDDNNVITNVEFIGGCPGNLIGLKQLVIGQNAFEVADKLANIPCGGKTTSCPDQLSKAIRQSL
ncbi:TIGR03905 family TSCPD domain-containing protein [Romboutsia sp. 1001216sp1]|uniref:TIGR03905 family TSCPD domain-containing protein n=1 Tax=Romboutsia TaxID=1501226 RepID=UPI000A8A9C8D|nr:MULTISPECIES: TIGR03905 family TSCPD domain-containing protein [Romboutsia]MDB8789234.1 TIGR03905 family TSCPD domain-containing protein [Romboutsia sp. 1001216sp1]MDB8793236.1 TIGR03905 family TSCPD domain-containing protein [Romboutsia sp. 1001216sp1]MDB8796028.1 TIGR03905 family TSCPD domain-containing protein [Romboutsia sp. 1001216sp1]MDB8799524.1 TIGR03905 family TSCPD domain-containing protein [Romboutsia sp. 1001216sp1]MDB8802190.1 TIGR03905 family TSCPD domain-containing protein [R